MPTCKSSKAQTKRLLIRLIMLHIIKGFKMHLYSSTYCDGRNKRPVFVFATFRINTIMRTPVRTPHLVGGPTGF
jgi:hypothetical protein